MNLVSIIIPMFNEELNVINCVKVLKKQTNQRFDVLFVDDGSEDKTLENLEEIIKLGVEFNYRIITRVNGGASAARRTGIDLASTEYVMVFDCDDGLSDNCIDEIYNIYHNNVDVDIIIPEMCVENKSGIWNDFVFYTSDRKLSSLDCVENSLNGWKVHGCITIKKSIIQKSYIDYDKYNPNNENYINNDEVISRFNFSNSKNIVRSNGVYYYCHNSLSTTKKVNSNRYLMIKNALIVNNYYSKNTKLKKKVDEELIAVIWSTKLYMYRNKLALKNISKWEKMIYQSTKEIIYFDYCHRLSLKKIFQLTILKSLNIR